MKRLLFIIHRWSGVALAIFMLLWFASGLLIVYAKPLNQNRAEQWARAETLAPQASWLTLGEALQRRGASGSAPAIQEARLQRIAGQPLWLIETVGGERFALAASDGRPWQASPAAALHIAAQWAGPGAGQPRLLETLDAPVSLRNQEAWKPFHRVSLDDGQGGELLISARTGEVVQASSRWGRALYWAGSWLHLFRFLDLAGFGQQRADVLLWLAGGALLATLSGLVVGWLRWRPGWFGRASYGGGRVHPYRQAWFTWHFWAGLGGGLLTLTWTLSAFLNGNPGQIFSPAAPAKAEYARYVGPQMPRPLLDWRPALPPGASDVVELSLRHLGEAGAVVAGHRDGTRQALAGSGMGEAAARSALARLAGREPAGASVRLDDYDNYYYPRHGRGTADRPLPVLRISLGDAADTRFYVDPLDGRLLLRQDASRRAYRWLWSALHHWDLPGLYQRPLWDVWMLAGIGGGLVLALSAVVLGWRRLGATFRRRAGRPAVAVAVAVARPALAAEGEAA